MKRIAARAIMTLVFICFSVGCSNNSDDIGAPHDGSGSGAIFDNSISSVQSIESVDSEIIESTEPVVTTSETGGNSGTPFKTVLIITVSEDKYYVDNHAIEYDDLIEKISSLDDESYITLYDENSTLKAFRKIMDYLDENKIPYEIAE